MKSAGWPSRFSGVCPARTSWYRRSTRLAAR